VLVFIDESGDAGFKFGRGSSKYFVIAAVVFTDNFSADSCDRAIEALRRDHAFSLEREFHFTECSDKLREAFFRCVAPEAFSYYAFVIDKARLYAGAPTFSDGKSFYQFAVSVVCDNARKLMRDAKVVIDKHGDRAFKQQLEKTLKRQMTDADGCCLIRKVRMEASHSNNLVQLADMVCGAVARSYNAAMPEGGRFRKLLVRRERRVQLWPQKW
jgi:hypothetical protein